MLVEMTRLWFDGGRVVVDRRGPRRSGRFNFLLTMVTSGRLMPSNG
ncbi:MAG: hypothetical protein R2849_12285 [Thermomicrobiales bacterium]